MSPSTPDDATILSPDGPASGASFPRLQRVGPYRILRVLGEGGMGVVYEAEQTEPVRRRVALKVVKIGMDTRAVVARFEAERQALAVMNHPGIARVLDAGASEVGRPYFVMELVEGVGLTEYCDAHRLPIRDRLTLFVSICSAVQHAHQKGVIHRDLKPSNILVTEIDGQARAKIIDFGIAKATGTWLTEKTPLTAHGQPIGTPAYTSPEQAQTSDLDVDTRADIFSLGVILYELLVGRLPVDPVEPGIHAFFAWLVDRDRMAPTPATRFAGLGALQASLAELRGTDPKSLARALKGDLDWIVMKAIDKNRSSRFETVSALAKDVERYLHQEPVDARPPSTSYRLRKFIRRHAVGVAFATTLAVLIVASAIAMGIQAGVVARERDRAEQEAATAQAVARYMEETLLAPDPIEGLGRDVTVAEALEGAAVQLDDAFASQPEVEASARSAIGWAYFRLGRYDEAEPLLKQALDIRRETLGPKHQDLAQSIHQWGRLFQTRAQYDSAEVLYGRALEMRREVVPAEHPDVVFSLQDLGILLGEVGRYDEAENVLREAMALEKSRGEETLEFVNLQNQIGVILWNQGKYVELEPLWLQMLSSRRKLLGEEHPLVAESINNLAVLFDNTGRQAEAEQYYRDAIAIMKEALGPDHEQVSASLANLAILLDTKGSYDEAEELYREALRIDRKQLGDKNPAVASDLVNLASMLCELGRGNEALPFLDEAIVTFAESLEPGNWRIGNTQHWKGRCLAGLGRFAEAERELMKGIETMSVAFGSDHRRVVRAKDRLADLYDAWGRPEMAAQYRSSDG